MALSPSGSWKRACVAVNIAIQASTCLVDGCTADLSNFKKYHQRHKVCEVHSKTPQVSINGQKLRFCQQCSRFHSLEEFDEGKRSCRKRLDGHNRRRRKRQPYLFSSHLGTNMLQFNGPPVHPAPTNPLWTGIVKASSRNDKLFCDNYQPPAWVGHWDFAPSLLSSSASPSQASNTTLSHGMYPSSGSFSTTASPLDPGLNYDGLENDSDVGWGGMINMGPHHHASRDHEDPQTLPFYWQY